jgi:signal transduction histidine kinase
MDAAHPFDELLAYVGFTETDSAALAAAWPGVAPHTRAVADRFYDTILRFQGARQVFADDAQVERLKVSLVRWLEELHCGPHDHAYHDRRLAIGKAHVRVQLPSRYMFTAMSGVRSHLRELLHDQPLAGVALDKILDVELAIMTGTFMEENERDRLTKLRDLIVSHLPSCILVLDDGNRVTSATSTRCPFVNGNPVGRLAHEALLSEVSGAVDMSAALHRASSSRQVVEFSRVDIVVDGRRWSVRLTVVPVEHPMAAILLHIEDLTTIVEHEDRARNAENLASLGTMAASVAHEIRNPLAGISGVVQVVASSLPADDDRLPALVRVQQQIARLGELVGELLLFARPVTAAMTAVDLRAVADHAAIAATASVGKPLEQVLVHGHGEARGDPVLVAQVLQNLVQNALQAGAKRIEVHVEVTTARIDVIDDGPGISAADRDKVFQPFFTTKVRGTGLGLPMARRIAEAMSGTLELLPPSPNKTGCHFRLRLKP